MKNKLFKVAVGISLVWSNTALSYFKDKATEHKPTNVGQNKAAGCSPAVAKVFMEFNDVRCLIETGGSMFQDRAAGVASYEVPKVTDNSTKHFAIFAGALWMGGTDVNGQLKLAALKFRAGNDFWTGPLGSLTNQGTFHPGDPQDQTSTRSYGAGDITPDECLAYDKFYTIRKSEVIMFQTWWYYNNVFADPNVEAPAKPDDEVMNRIENWPAHPKNAGFGQDYYLAPFYDNPFGTAGADGDYNPEDGDSPWYDDIMGRDDILCGSDRRISLFGDETHWWVFNDKGNIHTETQGEPIGMEIRAQAFAFATDDEVNRMTFYNYEMINRSTQTLQETYFAQYMDPDVGNPEDDFVGCDISRGLGYCYNGDNNDETNGPSPGYGSNPPAIGVDFFEGPYKDPDMKDNGYHPTSLVDALADGGIVYKGIGIGYGDGVVDNERLGMTRFSYYTNGAIDPYTDPDKAPEYYNFLKGKWSNGSDMVYGGAGYVGSAGATTTVSTYMFPGDSDPLGWATGGSIPFANWSEANTDGANSANAPQDRRFVQSAGPFTLKPGAVNNITVGIIYGRGSGGDLLSSVSAMKRADTKAQALFDNCFKILDPPMAPKLTIQELENELILMLDNPGTSHNNYKELYREEDKINITADTICDGSETDKFYKFEGYQIFQLKDAATSVADIADPTKAILVAQCDIKNGIGRLINYEFNEELGASIPVEKVKLDDTGIKHSFRVTEDQFALGNRSLVNHKSYYYVAIAYAYNNYQTYVPDQGACDIVGQKIPYISSRLGYDGSSIKSVSCIPHNPMPEADGTGQMVGYGTTPRITRLDGYGNGNRALTLTQASEDKIVQDGYLDQPVYDYGGGPINVKVVDPLNVTGGYYTCAFDDAGYDENGTNGADSAKWTIYHYDQEGGTLIDSVTSIVNISQDNEQIVPKWGVSVQIQQKKYTNIENTIANEYAYPISSEIEFADSSKKWLQGITDADGFFPLNWIRSGTNLDTNSTVEDPAYNSPSCYLDEVNKDIGKEYTRILSGTVAPHALVGYQCDYMPLCYYGLAAGSAPGSMKSYARISYTPSVDIVITSDKSKWTRCAVFELGRDENLNAGNGKPGGLRKSASVDKQGVGLGSSGCVTSEAQIVGATGMGWFPGYAIDLESGARLHMAFGENSFLANDNGADMVWNPSDRMFDQQGTPVFGGLQPIYVYSYNQKTLNGNNNVYDFPFYNESVNEVYNLMQLIEAPASSASAKRQLYGSLTWIANPMKAQGFNGLDSDVRIKLRVHKEYKNYVATNENQGRPMYSWNMDEIATVTSDNSRLVDARDMINVVPNPYYAFSEYEGTRLDTRVKITNLPEKCTVTIYSVNGKLIRTYKKDSEITSLDWDLNNHKGIPVAGGVYLIHVDIPGVGEKILKFFGGMRQIDLHGI